MWAVVWTVIGVGWLVLGVHLARRLRRPPTGGSIVINEKRQQEFADRDRH